jgi:hypothetical protein
MNATSKSKIPILVFNGELDRIRSGCILNEWFLILNALTVSLKLIWIILALWHLWGDVFSLTPLTPKIIRHSFTLSWVHYASIFFQSLRQYTTSITSREGMVAHCSGTINYYSKDNVPLQHLWSFGTLNFWNFKTFHIFIVW